MDHRPLRKYRDEDRIVRWTRAPILPGRIYSRSYIAELEAELADSIARP